MSGISQTPGNSRSVNESLPVRMLLIFTALLFLVLFLILPLVAVFYNAFHEGLPVYKQAITDPATIHAVILTFLAVFCAVPLNCAFGVAAAWAISKFRFRGKNALITLIDLPLTVSPVVSGTIFILIFGAHGLLGPWLSAHNIKIIFAIPGIVLVTIFVTLPFVARELLPVMTAQGNFDEEAALTLGASGWKTFLRITLPNIRWGLFYGVVLSVARAMGEFGAVSVVSGHIRGKTITMPLHVEILYNEYNFAAAFAVASLLTFVSIMTLGLKKYAEVKTARQNKELEDFMTEKRML
ncbi:sulfate ABC transporter permease subunit CysW [candidate division KSB1 bacterium]|nr:sulfate ABC transporter permease subunit CysW [candidate division KSB1 bacterium]